jgi:putative hydrolase of the HAD superfamily
VNKAMSFDVWNTLILPNPEFGKSRPAVFAKILGVSPEIAKSAYSIVHKQADDVQEQLGVCIQYKQLLWAFVEKCSELSGKNICSDAEAAGSPYVILELQQAIHDLFVEHPPIVADGISEMFEQLVNHDVEFGIISNTSFILGTWLHRHLIMSLPAFFGRKIKFTLWSDQHGYSKPHQKMFSMAKCMCGDRNMIHVGDNLVTDGKSSCYGFEFLHTPSANETAEIVLSKINSL